MSGSSIVGSALFTSGAMSYTSIMTGWLDFAVGSVSLNSSAVYMAILAPYSVSSGMAVMDVGTELGDAYAGGHAVYTSGVSPATDARCRALAGTGGSRQTGQDFALRLQ
jgi:hypothetical protein